MEPLLNPIDPPLTRAAAQAECRRRWGNHASAEGPYGGGWYSVGYRSYAFSFAGTGRSFAAAIEAAESDRLRQLRNIAAVPSLASEFLIGHAPPCIYLPDGATPMRLVDRISTPDYAALAAELRA